MQRIAIIGAGGFVGRHLLALLSTQGKHVAGVSFEERPAALPFTDWLACDLQQDPGALVDFLSRFGPDTVVHLAATSSEPVAATRPWSVLHNNVLSTLNTLTACRRLTPVPRCVIVSSSAVYGRHDQEDLPLAETHDLKPLTIYGVSKVAVEALGLQHWRAFQLPVILVRPFNLTGPGEHASFVTSAFSRQIALIETGRQSPVIIVGNLGTTRDFTDVRDAVNALTRVAERGEAGEAYNLCSGVGVAIGDLLRRLLMATRTAIDIEPDPALMRPVEIQAQWGDSTKIKRATGWEPHFGLDQTLADVLDDWRVRIQNVEA